MTINTDESCTPQIFHILIEMSSKDSPTEASYSILQV